MVFNPLLSGRFALIRALIRTIKAWAPGDVRRSEPAPPGYSTAPSVRNASLLPLPSPDDLRHRPGVVLGVVTPREGRFSPIAYHQEMGVLEELEPYL